MTLLFFMGRGKKCGKIDDDRISDFKIKSRISLSYPGNVLARVQRHTIYTRNNMGQKFEGDCGLWVLNEILKKTYAENLKKIVGAVWEIPAKQHSRFSPI